MPRGDRQNRIPWTRAELDLLCETWPRGGLVESRKAFPHRTDDSIAGKACLLTLRVGGRAPYLRDGSTELIDAALRRAYKSGRPNLPELERTTGRSRNWLKYRASALGISSPRRGSPCAPWLEEEDRILTEGIEAGFSAHTIRKHLADGGHVRSLQAIITRVAVRDLRFNRSFLTARDVGKLFDIGVKSVLRWIECGYLAASRATGPSSERSTEEMAQPMWCVTSEAIRTFMLKHPEKWDHRVMKKEILLDLLVPKRFNQLGREKESA